MSLLKALKQSIFLRIYAGLLFVCLCVALFAHLLVNTINSERMQVYREDIATANMSLVSDGIVRQSSKSEREYWLEDVSELFGDTFILSPLDSVKLSSSEKDRLLNGKTVVRYLDSSPSARMYHLLPNEPTLVQVDIDQVSEQQVRAMTILLLDDLSLHSSLEAKRKRLTEIGKNFPYPVSITAIQNISLDSEQLSRLRRDEMVILFKDNTSSNSNNAYIQVIAPVDLPSMALVIGPVELFKWFPFNLIISVVLVSMLLVSIGVYALIFPLERKLQVIQSGVNEVGDGNLNTKVQVVGQDEIAKLAATFNTMTEHIKRLIESQRELTRAVSHELRTPVARIRFAVDMLADTDDAESREMQRAYIDEDIESLNGLIDEILTYAKLEEGSPELKLETIDLKELVAQVVRETKALGKDIEVIGDVPTVKYSAVADRTYLHRVVQNLAGNALRYAESKIIISAGVNKGNAYVSVEDDGHGISDEDKEKVFIPFSRLDDSRTRASGGYGLGLSIVSRIAFWFNGNMDVDDSPELGGARFTMTWPVKPLTRTISADEITQKQAERKLISEISV